MPSQAPVSAARQSSISVVVRVRPFTTQEQNRLVCEPSTPIFPGDGGFLQTSGKENDSVAVKTAQHPQNMPHGLRKIVDVVDDRMLIFDPPENSALGAMQKRAFPHGPARGRIRDHRFVFDGLFDENASQEEVFCATTKPLLDNVLDGYNASVFAYGATGCGKTHTISGTRQDPGVIYLTMAALYQKIGVLADTRRVSVQVSFLEIYNETIRDLLAPETPPKRLVLREDAARRIVVANLSVHTPGTVDDVMQLITRGNENRTSSPTEANAASSRSHAVIQIHVSSHARTAGLSEEHTTATLSVIDLAGSERAAATRNRGARLHEGANINRSLLALGNCINALCDPGRRAHVPYRDSKLTRLLKFSLGGNCRTVMVVCVSPSSQHYDETWNTLQYAARAREIKTSVSRNRHNLDRHVGSYLRMITEQRQEIDELRAREAVVISEHAEKSNKNNAACLQAVRDMASSARETVARRQHDQWRKCFSLAKRKFLLLNLQQLHQISRHVEAQHGHGRPLSAAVRRLLLQCEQLQAKLNSQVVALERFYDSGSDMDAIIADHVTHTLKKCSELDGWTAAHTDLFHDSARALHDSLQRDILVNSSVLFDFLVAELGSYAFPLKALCANIDVSQRHRIGAETDLQSDADDTLDTVSAVLEKMNDSDYDVALEEATARFIGGKHGAQVKPEDQEGSPTILPVDLHVRAKDKRQSSPSRDSPASKRSAKSTMFLKPSMDDCDLSLDDSAYKSAMDDDSPLFNHVNQSVLDFDALDDDHMLTSPPGKPPQAEPRGRLPRRRKSVSYSDTQVALDSHMLKPSLLNKQASTIVANARPELQPHSPPPHEPYAHANSSIMD
ncbi:hypothetical protein OXX79_002525 [Metschnikowia pulcherrima]